MAANPQPFMIPSLLTIIIFLNFFSLPTCLSQQNIQVYYPFSQPVFPPPVFPTPPTENDPTPVFPPPNTPPTSTIPRSSTRAAVGRAIGITAASTIVLSALIFFILVKTRRKRENRANNAIVASTNTTNNNNSLGPVFRPQDDNFVRLEGNVKGVIVDENGLDVLYWRKMEENEKKGGLGSFKKQQEYRKLKAEEKEIVSVSGKGKRFDQYEHNHQQPVQESPLLRGKSSTSQSPVWSDNQEVEIKRVIPTRIPSGKGSFKALEKQNSSVQLSKMSTTMPVLPPPPGVVVVPPPPPPKPPVLAMEAVPKAKPPPKGPAPPPPPLPTNVASVPKPPRGMPNKRSSSSGESSNGSSKVQMKALHWDKVNVNPNVEHSMVWDKLDKGSFKFDGDLMEALFGYVATNRKSPPRDTARGDKQGPPSQIFILDTRKSQNTAIVLKSLGISRKEIIDALIEGHGLNADIIEKLARIAPNDEETSQILAFKGDPTRLADAESFLYYLLKAIPSAFTRFSAMLFRTNYDSEVSSLKESLKSLESACDELRTRGIFLKLLEAVLKAGNRLNAGTSRGNAQAFNLTALRKLSDVKSSDGKTTLLQFVVQEVVRAEGKRCVLNRSRDLTRASSRSAQASDNSISKEDREKEYMMLGLPVIGGLSGEFSNVKKVATLDYELIVKTISELEAQVAETRKKISSEDGGFAQEMNGFLDTAELEMRVVKEEETRVMALVKKTTDYYQAGFSKDKGVNLLQLFVIVRDFLGMVDKVCIEIARDVQNRKPLPVVASSSNVPSGSTSPESPRVFRFPKLPANFMSEGSKSSSSGSDDDESNVR